MFLLLSDSENTRDILLTAKDIGLFNGEYAIITVDLLLKHDHEFETYEHSHRGSELSHEGKNVFVTVKSFAVFGNFILAVMARSHCPGPGPGTMGLNIMLCTVHTTQGPGQGPGPGPGSDGFATHFYHRVRYRER